MLKLSAAPSPAAAAAAAVSTVTTAAAPIQHCMCFLTGDAGRQFACSSDRCWLTAAAPAVVQAGRRSSSAGFKSSQQLLQLPCQWAAVCRAVWMAGGTATAAAPAEAPQLYSTWCSCPVWQSDLPVCCSVVQCGWLLGQAARQVSLGRTVRTTTRRMARWWLLPLQYAGQT